MPSPEGILPRKEESTLGVFSANTPPAANTCRWALCFLKVSEFMNTFDWYIEYTKQTQELRRLFAKCLSALSEDEPNLGAVHAIRDIAVTKYNDLTTHWKLAFPTEPLPKGIDIRRHLRFSESVDFWGLLSDDFFEADIKALTYLSGNLKRQRNDPYVSEERLRELSSISKTRFDLSRLIYICKELNLGYQSGQIYALPLLVRSILDHVPPIFGCKNFKEVANNYSGTKSFRESAAQLDESSRKIGDSFLHTQIRQSESLPSAVQVDFRHSLDVVLSEIIRILR